MSRLFPALTLILAAIVLLFPALPCASAPLAGTGGTAARILVGFREAPGAAELQALRAAVEKAAGLYGWEGPELVLPGVARLRLPAVPDLPRLKELLSSLPFTAFVEDDHVVRISADPNDPRYDEQWHLPSVSAPRAWDLTTGSSGVTIAVVDTGVDYNHPDLKDKCVAGYNFVDRSSDPMDDHGHGTHVAGIAAAVGNNSTGVAGVDWKARVLPVKVLNAQGAGYDSDVAEGIRYAADHGAKVINLSLGSPDYSYTLAEAVNYAWNKGALVVAASGNNGSSVNYPAAFDRVVAVGALDSNDSIAYFSNRGPELDLTAPGVSILSTIPGSYGKMSGTSMASPVVAGCASLLLAANPGYTPAQVKEALESGAVDLGATGFDELYGHGKVDAFAALTGSAPRPEPEPEPEPGPQPAPPEDGTWSPPEPGGEKVWYLAEGYTGPGFQTYILVQNPNGSEALLRAEYVDPGGGYVEEFYTLGAHCRLTLNLNAIIPDREVSTCISSQNDVGVVVERAMYFDCGGRSDGHCASGSPGLSTTWYFAEGYTGAGFDEYILVLNPWFTSNQARLTLYDEAGNEQSYEYWLLPASRLTVHVNELAPGKNVAAKVETASGSVAERAMYFDYDGRRGGHCAMGTPEPSNTLFFAEGYTGAGFDEWLLLFNPSPEDRTATVDYRFTDGSELRANYVVRACRRLSVHVNREAPDREVAIKVSCGGEGLVAERAMYFDYRGMWDGGHCSEGATSPAERWDLAEGYTGPGFETWILIQNASAYESADVRLAVMGNTGMSSPRAYVLAPGSRTTIFLNDIAASGDASVTVYSANGVPMVVERAMYFDCGGRKGGSANMGCR